MKRILGITHLQPPGKGRDISQLTRLLKAPSILALNTSRAGAFTASLCCGLFLITLTVKDFLLMSYINLIFQFKTIPLFSIIL